jgi:formamidopyrimidine-DNA glycosylase
LSGIGEDLADKIREMKLGPDTLELDADTFRERFGGRKGGVKAALMNQQIVAGIGNIYSDEILFQARLRPRSSVVRLDGLHKETNHVLNAAIEWVANPQELPDSFLLPHRREGEGVPTGKR